jgi:Transposase DDE domain group 1
MSQARAAIERQKVIEGESEEVAEHCWVVIGPADVVPLCDAAVRVAAVRVAEQLSDRRVAIALIRGGATKGYGADRASAHPRSRPRQTARHHRKNSLSPRLAGFKRVVGRPTTKNHLAADRTSCHEAEANQFRLFLHAGAYWLLWSMRRVMPKGSAWRVMQFDTLRLRLVKLAARVVELKTQIKIHLPSSAPNQAIFGMLLDRLPRLVT